MSGITPLPSAPLVSDNTATFNAKAFALAAALEQLVAEINAEIPAIDIAYSSGLAAMGAANFVGEWSTLTGALAIPASVSHQELMWVLKQNVADVTVEVPGVSVNWLDVSPSKSSLKNRIINGGFTVNQRAVTSPCVLTTGVYGHDRWKAGASGCTYTFSAGSAGVPVTITISAGSLQQVIEGCHLPEGGTYTLSWTGTAQAKIAGGSYAASPITVTGLTAGANCTVEFGTGTVGLVQVEPGSASTSFDYRDYGREIYLCQRYFYLLQNYNLGYTVSTATASGVVSFKQDMRVAPTITNLSFGVQSGNIGTPAALNINYQSAYFYNSASNWSVGVWAIASAWLSAEL